MMVASRLDRRNERIVRRSAEDTTNASRRGQPKRFSSPSSWSDILVWSCALFVCWNCVKPSAVDAWPLVYGRTLTNALHTTVREGWTPARNLPYGLSYRAPTSLYDAREDDAAVPERPVNMTSVEEHDAAVMQRLLRPFQIGDLLQSVIGRSILVFVAVGFLLQYFGYSYIVEWDVPSTAGGGGVEVSNTRRGPPRFRIGTIEERQFLEEIRRDMKEQQQNVKE